MVVKEEPGQDQQCPGPTLIPPTFGIHPDRDVNCPARNSRDSCTSETGNRNIGLFDPRL